MKVSERFRKMLRERCEHLIDGGINCFPKWLHGRVPSFRKGESYQKFLVTPISEDNEFKKFILKRFEDPEVGGIVIVGHVGGVVAIDNDALKVKNMEKEFLRVVKEFGHIVYIDRRVVLQPKVSLRGMHATLFVDRELFHKYIFKIEHNYNAEFTIRAHGLITVYPSLRIEKSDEGNELSVYLKLSQADIFDALYDERLEVLPKIIEAFGGKLVLQPIDYSKAEASEYTGSPGEPWHGLQFREITANNVFLFLKNFARIMHCEGLERIVESIEKEEPFPMPYVIYQSLVPDTNHPRSSWTLAENIIGRILGEAGADESALLKVREAIERSQEKYMKINSSVDHRTVRANLTRAYKFKEFGHDKPGACVFKLMGMCGSECNLTCWLKLKTSSAREALEKAALLAIAGHEVQPNA
ncbi:hypothetical protein Igag_1970 [Ignisphaera aggregans DSM 17230]|uniref:Uncharacterized protein n=1 Tax=Ignisphaera aggregans (strain DSM 17230 / JCM 13409 / AQ1.S1) TaxID=583356 RepID=E0STH6_IGNAA|nr:hypothetical protein Igag_1970 [Ignisphaera aggregans DSM 17230]